MACGYNVNALCQFQRPVIIAIAVVEHESLRRIDFYDFVPGIFYEQFVVCCVNAYF